MTRQIRTKTVDKGLYVNFLQKAEENLAAAKAAFVDDGFNASAVSAVHAVISAADAYCVYSIGKKCASENHKDASGLIIDTFFPKETSAGIAAKFDRVVRIKNMAEYEERLVHRKEAESALRNAEAMVRDVKAALKE